MHDGSHDGIVQVVVWLEVWHYLQECSGRIGGEVAITVTLRCIVARLS